MKYLPSPKSMTAYGLYGDDGKPVAIIEFEPSANGIELIRLIAAAPLMLAALEMVIQAATVFDEAGLTPGQIEIKRAAEEAGMSPTAYVMTVIRAAIAAARGE